MALTVAGSSVTLTNDAGRTSDPMGKVIGKKNIKYKGYPC